MALKMLKSEVKRIAKGRYLVTVKAADNGRGKMKTSYDDEGIIAETQEQAMDLLGVEISRAAKAVADVTMNLPFAKKEKDKK